MVDALNAKEPITPWYRVGMVWMIIAIPLTAVVLGVVLITLSVVTYDGLVVDDYYKHGKEINLVLARDHEASRLGVSAELSFDLVKREFAVTVDRGGKDIDLNTARIRFMHPTRAGEDKSVTIDAEHTGMATTVALPPLAAGRWIIELGTEAWRLVGTIRLPEQTSIRLLPQTYQGS